MSDTIKRDLISRQDAIDALKKMKINKPLDSDRWVISDCLNAIVSLPSAQPERKIGRWICSDDMWECGVCSRCGWDSGDPWEHCLKNLKYCSNCGAEMDGAING